MHKRAEAVRTRARVRAWRYRQRNLASGVWFRIRLVLADAESAYAISAEQATELRAEGFSAEACGFELAPEKTILFIEAERATALGVPPIRVGLGPDFHAAHALALVPFAVVRERRLRRCR
jgi:hypothetical protein